MNPCILADFPVVDPLNEYFKTKNIEYNPIPKVSEVPLVDLIHNRTKGKENVILILNTLTLKRLFDSKSLYHSFEEMIDSGIKILLYSRLDCMMHMANLFDSKESAEFSSWINDLKPIVLTDGIAGKYFKENYDKCKFIELHNPFLHHGNTFPELSSCKRHDPNKDFLCLMAQQKSGRSHRDLLHEQMTAKGLIDHTVYKFSPRSTETHADLNESFSEAVIKGIDWNDGLPPIHYYNQTNLEIVAETFGHHGHDDTFFITEKTTKPIAMKHPFMVLSTRHFLKNLRNIGFRTFGEHLDESYDLEHDVKKRVEIIINNLVMSKRSSGKLYNDTREIRNHNLLNLQHQAGMYNTKLFNRMDQILKNI